MNMAHSILLPVITSARVAWVFRPCMTAHQSTYDSMVAMTCIKSYKYVFGRSTNPKSIFTIQNTYGYVCCHHEGTMEYVQDMHQDNSWTEDKGNPRARGLPYSHRQKFISWTHWMITTMVKIHLIKIRILPSETRIHHLAHGRSLTPTGVQKYIIMMDLHKKQ